ncbi:MAG: hypothetical protein IIY94_05415, partial [Oscillospiraceae bacterium]|nr:hypothetical protein [Oscillospiraceae bacterium]
LKLLWTNTIHASENLMPNCRHCAVSNPSERALSQRQLNAVFKFVYYILKNSDVCACNASDVMPCGIVMLFALLAVM